MIQDDLTISQRRVSNLNSHKASLWNTSNSAEHGDNKIEAIASSAVAEIIENHETTLADVTFGFTDDFR